ncbi:MAG: hypothetical protein KA022_01670 [Candidatus Omnitrophica bacterium]|nr:hypothetical protein [Candidatus Omnitrophota bacterium]
MPDRGRTKTGRAEGIDQG